MAPFFKYPFNGRDNIPTSKSFYSSYTNFSNMFPYANVLKVVYAEKKMYVLPGNICYDVSRM